MFFCFEAHDFVVGLFVRYFGHTFIYYLNYFAEESKAEELREEANNLMSTAANTKLDDLVNYTVREWLPYNDYEAPEAVEATELPGPIPTLQRLWFGQAPEDKQKRLQAFLSCLYCDGFNHAAIPPHLGNIFFYLFFFF